MFRCTSPELSFRRRFGSCCTRFLWGIRTYNQQSEFSGNPKAIRTVGTANGINKIAILIPCHRVIGLNRELMGYAGGICRKQKLLELEKAILF